VKISHIEHVFITYGSWDNIGGLSGMLKIFLLQIPLEKFRVV